LVSKVVIDGIAAANLIFAPGFDGLAKTKLPAPPLVHLINAADSSIESDHFIKKLIVA
jgi:hypothetical protein